MDQDSTCASTTWEGGPNQVEMDSWWKVLCSISLSSSIYWDIQSASNQTNMASTYREQMQIVCLDTNTEQDPYLRQPSTQRMATPELVCSLQRAIGNRLTPLPNLPIWYGTKSQLGRISIFFKLLTRCNLIILVNGGRRRQDPYQRIKDDTSMDWLSTPCGIFGRNEIEEFSIKSS